MTARAALPGMRERTVTVSSAAKSWNVTGRKTGWALAPIQEQEWLRAIVADLTEVALVRVAAIPAQVFCDDPQPCRTKVRFTFGKRHKMLHRGVEHLERRG